MLIHLRSESLPIRTGFFALAALSIAFLAWNVQPSPSYFPVDFKYFWLAGTLWNDGVSPYGDSLVVLGASEFPEDRINPLFYPPNWRAIAGVMALFTPTQAETLWAGASALAIILASWQLALVSRRFQHSLSTPRTFALFLFVIACLAHGSEIAILIGQPTPFILLALTSLLLAIDRANAPLAVIAMTALLLKPQLSIPIAAAAMFLPFLRTPTVIAGFITGLLAVYGLGLQSPIENFLAFLNNLSAYKAYPENWPIHMSGPNYVLALFGVKAVSVFALLGICISIILGAALLVVKKTGAHDTDTELKFVLFAALSAAALMPTHNFDFHYTMPALLLFPLCHRRAGLLLLLGLFLLMRSMSLSLLTEGVFFADKTSMVGLYDTVGSLLIWCIAGLALVGNTQNSVLGVRRPSMTAAPTGGPSVK